MKLSLSIDETANATGIGRTKVYELIAAGRLVARKIGRRTVILQADLDAFLNSFEKAEIVEKEDRRSTA